MPTTVDRKVLKLVHLSTRPARTIAKQATSNRRSDLLEMISSAVATSDLPVQTPNGRASVFILNQPKLLRILSGRAFKRSFLLVFGHN